MMHALHPRRRTRRPYYGAEEEEEVGADLNGSAGLFGCVHCLYRSNPPAPVRHRPIRLLHDQHRPDLPPDRLSIDTVVIDDMAVVGRWYEQGRDRWIGDARHSGPRYRIVRVGTLCLDARRGP